jgi:hypothetical protein
MGSVVVDPILPLMGKTTVLLPHSTCCSQMCMLLASVPHTLYAAMSTVRVVQDSCCSFGAPVKKWWPQRTALCPPCKRRRCKGAPECYLHLHGMSQWVSLISALPAVYSSPAAPGLVMASGNVGTPGNGLDSLSSG